MIYLPTPFSIIRLKSFWLAISICIAIIVSYPLSTIIPFHWLLWAILTICVVSIPGLYNPSIAVLPYRIHNKVCDIFSRYAQAWILFTCFCIISIAIGKKADSLYEKDVFDEESSWIPREFNEVYNIETANNVTVEIGSRGFSANYAQWATESGNWWTLLLLPFLSMISILEQEKPSHTVPDNVYTLY